VSLIPAGRFAGRSRSPAAAILRSVGQEDLRLCAFGHNPDQPLGHRSTRCSRSGSRGRWACNSRKLVDQLERPAGGRFAPVKVSVIHPASLRASPTSPRPRLNLARGPLVGLAVGVWGGVLRKTLDTAVKNAEQAEKLVGAPILGPIGFGPDAAKYRMMVPRLRTARAARPSADAHQPEVRRHRARAA